MRKRRIAGNITIILLSFLSVSCLNKTKFSKKDYDWIDVYEENDILVFQEVNSKAKDTTIIKKKNYIMPNINQ